MSADKDRPVMETPRERFDREIDRLNFWFDFWWSVGMGTLMVVFSTMLGCAFWKYVLL